MLIVVPTILFLASAELLRKAGTKLHLANSEVEELGRPNDSTRRITDNSTARILEHTDTYIVADKPFAVPCHHSWYIGRRSTTPMLQRIRDTVHRPINLVHRLDRGASGCLLCTYAAAEKEDISEEDTLDTTRLLSEALAEPVSRKTYIALVPGEGIVRGVDFKKKGWFLVDRPIQNERKIEKEAQTWFRFVAGQDNDSGRNPDKARASLVLARPVTGRWHQIRRHLNGLSHPILGDSEHGNSKVNREWKSKHGLLPERLCLHLARLEIVPKPGVCPQGIDVTSPLPPDLLAILQGPLKSVLDEAERTLLEEGIRLR